MFYHIAFMCWLATALPPLPEEPLTPFEILERIDRNTVFRTAYSEIDMILTIETRTLTKTLTSFAEGNDQSFIEFLSPARDKGTKILKTGDIIRVYYPSAERVMRLSGHMLRQSMMGSDFSFEDMTERATRMREEYDGELLADQVLDGRPCYVLMLTTKNDKKIYYKRKIWVDRERFLGLQEELIARSGKVLKVLTVNEVRQIRNRFYPVRITMADKLRSNTRTEMIVKKIEFDVAIPPDTFSERNLLKK